MATGTEKKKEHREITYQVGWKKGRIEWSDAASGAASDPPAELVRSGDEQLGRLWKAAPAWPAGVALPLLYALPAACFVLTLVLIWGLRSVF